MTTTVEVGRTELRFAGPAVRPLDDLRRRDEDHGRTQGSSGPGAKTKRSETLQVSVAGGGPVGLAFALSVHDMLGSAADVTVFDGRWTDRRGGVVWKGEDQGNRRRDQVVTIQSGVAKDLPRGVQHALFGTGDFTTMWPHGRNSPQEHGQPRNLRIKDVEDRLLSLARVKDIRLVPQRYEPAPGPLGCDVLAICDGANSPTRDRLVSAFGTPDPTPYLVDGRLAEDVVLSLSVTSRLDPASAVVLTVAQSRFLLNTHRGRGVLNMRLAPDEARELVMVDFDGRETEECIVACKCALSPVNYGGDRIAYVCLRHRAALKAPIDPASPLWRRVRQAMRLFGIAENDLHGVAAFRSSMTQRSRFSAELVPAGNGRTAGFGFLLGDSGGPIHVWPGRGLNYGLSGAISLARCLKEKWNVGGRLRHADFARHEANMHMLQYRHKARAWRAMVRFDEQGRAKSIADVIQDCLQAPRRRDIVIAQFMERLSAVTTRLHGRMDSLPDMASLRHRVEAMDDETLTVLAGSGAWETLASGGEEVDVTRLFPGKADRGPIVDTPDLPSPPTCDVHQDVSRFRASR